MNPVLLIGRYPYSLWVLGARPGGIESYRPFSQLGVLPCDHENMGGSPWLLRFVTISVQCVRNALNVESKSVRLLALVDAGGFGYGFGKVIIISEQCCEAHNVPMR